MYSAPGKWNMSKCTNSTCGLLWLNPMPVEEDLWKIYVNYYTHGTQGKYTFDFIRKIENKYYEHEYGYKNLEKPNSALPGWLVKLFPTEKAELDFRILGLEANEGGKLLDIGCGNGHLIKRLSNMGWDVEGMDFDPVAVEYCKSQGLNARSGNFFDMNYPSNYYDAVTMSHVIEHVPDPAKTLKEVYRILKPGGTLVMETPNSDSWIYNDIMQEEWLHLHPPAHIIIFNSENMKTLVESVNFEIKKLNTNVRNDAWTYSIGRLWKTDINKTFEGAKPGKGLLIKGKLIQLLGWLKLQFNSKSGGELYIKCTKPR
jgi:2-polyprenyl-3-methyl-5-hydroxy-6-metoxy-1,4-benzoquinol methylase